MTSLWTTSDMTAAMRADKAGALPAECRRHLHRQPHHRPRATPSSRSRDARDGHDFVEAALKAGAGVAVIARDKRNRFAADAPLLAR